MSNQKMQNTIPSDFVYLSDIAPSIIQDIRYHGDNNFVGRQIDGYGAPRAMLPRKTAEAVARVQEYFRSEGMSLVIYEAYRPQAATDDFISWSENLQDDKMQRLYYPRLSKPEIFTGGYLSKTSSHTRGAAVDVSLIPIGQNIHGCIETDVVLKDGYKLTCLDDGTMDMGGHFDLLDEVSWHDSPLVTKRQGEMRNLLRSGMEAQGFGMYNKEWWHYALKDEPFPNTYFDFAIR